MAVLLPKDLTETYAPLGMSLLVAGIVLVGFARDEIHIFIAHVGVVLALLHFHCNLMCLVPPSLPHPRANFCKILKNSVCKKPR